MSYLLQSSQASDQNDAEKQDQEKQDNTVLTQTSGDLGAEPVQASASGTSERPKDAARQTNLGRSQVLERNFGKSGNPFQFQQTRQALQASKGQVQSEKNQYMQNAVAPYQFGADQTQAVQNWSRGADQTAQPEWMAKFQQGTPQQVAGFESKAQTEFAPVRAMQTDAGIRSYLRDPNDPETRSGEQAIDFSILNADPQFNINREAVLRDYSDLLGTKGEIEANAQAEARRAQLDAFEKYKQGVTQTLDTEAQAIQDAAKQAESAYDVGFGNLGSLRNQILAEEMADLAKNSPENLRGYFFNPTGRENEFAQYFNPLTAESTKAEDFFTGEQAGNFNRIMAALGRGGNLATAGRFASQKGPGRESVGFNRQAFRDAMTNRAIAEDERARKSPFANTGAYDAGGATPSEFFTGQKAADPKPTPSSGESVGFGEDAAMRNWEKMADYLPMNPVLPNAPGVRFPTWAGPGGGVRFSQGGMVPGYAPKNGDSPENDVVTAQLSPGEIVIPRSSATDKESAKQFIDKMPFSKTRELLKNKYACGGKVKDQYNCGGMVKANKMYKKGGR
jgi:hypothetical protein